MATIWDYIRPSKWSGVEPQPFQIATGPEMRAYNPPPSERMGHWLTDLVGMVNPDLQTRHAYNTEKLGKGVRDILQMTPLGIGMSLADFAHAKAQSDPMGAAAAAIGLLPGAKPGIRAYHGSPHDFDKFDIRKIGTGEGAQAYGHGLYFAENEKVARDYRNNLQSTLFGGKDFQPDNIYHQAASILEEQGSRDAAIKYARQFKNSDPFYEDVARVLESNTTLPAITKSGRMYEVNINADPSHFLDWDRSLRDQSSHVQNVFEQIGVPVHRKTKEDPQAGSDLYWWLNSDKAGASRELKDAGIPGIRYLDQGSRQAAQLQQELEMYQNRATQMRLENNPANNQFITAAEDKVKQLQAKIDASTRNYVLFNDSLIDIIRKYGIVGVPAAGAVGYAMQPQEASAAKAAQPTFAPQPTLTSRINEIIDGLQWQDQWMGRMRLPLQRRADKLLEETPVWPPLR